MAYRDRVRPNYHLGRGRGRGRGGLAQQPWRSSTLEPTRPGPDHPAGAVSQSLCKPDLTTEAQMLKGQAVITGSRLVASYSWLDTPTPTILIPGKPPKWTPLPTPTKLDEDSEEYFRDPNGARYPDHPTEPAVLASLAEEPKLPSTVDIVCCSSTLGNLLRFVRGQEQAFRMSLEIVGNTVFLIRRENSPREIIPNVRGYGHTFPQAYTTWSSDVKGSCSHQRIMRYNFGGLNIMARFEADGYIAADNSHAASNVVPTTSSNTPEDPGDEISNAIHDLKLSTTTNNSKALEVRKGGRLVDQALVFDLKTRGLWKKDHDVLGEELPRVWMTQIPKFILAFHDQGVFKNIRVQDIVDDVKWWEEIHADELSYLAALLHRIRKILADGHQRLELFHSGDGTLKFHIQETSTKKALSAETEAMWFRGNDRYSDTDSDEDDVEQRMGGWKDATALDDVWQSDPDFTACSADSCGYCGQCRY